MYVCMYVMNFVSSGSSGRLEVIGWYGAIDQSTAYAVQHPNSVVSTLPQSAKTVSPRDTQ